MRPVKIINIIEEMYWAMCEVEDYFEQRQDIHPENPRAPNEEMRLFMVIRNAIERAEGKI